MTAIYQTLLGWLPPVVQVAILGVLAILVIKIVLVIIKLVLDAIPFI